MIIKKSELLDLLERAYPFVLGYPMHTQSKMLVDAAERLAVELRKLFEQERIKNRRTK